MSRSEGQAPTLARKDRQLESYLADRAAAGDRYFKSKYIAQEIELSAKEVGASMLKLEAAATDVEVQRWTRMTSPATWFVKPASTNEATASESMAEE